MSCVHLHLLCAHEVVFIKKNDFYVAYVKIIKFDTKITLFASVHEHKEHGDIHMNIFSIFLIF
jgi:hypothetical protein